MRHITPEQYLSAGRCRYGTVNPEVVDNPVWRWMLEMNQTPYMAHGELGIEYECERGNPFWTFWRFGMVKVQMPDGRVIWIGGEHEDWYDPDFWIYNEVIVQNGDDFEIYAYPRTVFPPTDFHTATLVDEKIVIVGRLGYPDDRGGAETPVFQLDTDGYAISPVSCSGESPGWIYQHRARFLADLRAIEISGGIVLYQQDGEEKSRSNVDTYLLFVDEWVWQRVTDNRAWRQFVLRIAGGEKQLPTSVFLGDALTTLGYPCDDVDQADEDNDDDLADGNPVSAGYRDPVTHVLLVHDVEVACETSLYDLRITIRGELGEAQVEELLERLKTVTGDSTQIVELSW